MSRKVLIVDSDRAERGWIEEGLRREGFEVSGADDGPSALEMVFRLDPDLVLADSHLHGIDLFRFCEELRRKGMGKTRPLLLLITAAESLDQDRLRSAGVSDFIQKPTKLEDMIGLIKAIRSLIVEEALPAEPPSSPESSLSAQLLGAAAIKMAREIIEKVAREVVPPLAESLIKEELERLKSGHSE